MDDYVNNREAHLKTLMDEYNTTRDEAKRVFLVAIYCGNFILDGKEPTFHAELVNETRSIAKKITDQIPDIKTMVKNIKESTGVKSINGKVLSHYLQEFEHVIYYLEVSKYCISKIIIIDNDCFLQADGIMIPKVNIKSDTMKSLLIEL